MPSAGWSGTVGLIVDDISIKAANGTLTNNAPATYAIGTTTVTWTATDAAGNSATCTQDVTVTDNELPVANCKPLTITLSGGTATIVATDVNNNSTDNCGIQSYSIDKTNFSCADIGNNTVTLTVTDIHGNKNTCAASVTIVGEIPTCSIASIPSDNTYTGGIPTNLYLGYGPQSTTLLVTPLANGAPYTYSWSPSANLSDATSGAPTFTPTTPGNYTFTVTTTNKFGCTTTCSITICVLDIRVPGTDGKKVYVCHLPPGNIGNPQTIAISVNAVSTHIFNPGHGDHLGTCEQTPCTNPALMTRSPQGSAVNELLIGELSISARPNPSQGYFNLLVQSSQKDPVSVE